MILSPCDEAIGLSDTGRRVGESHPKAILTDNDVEMIRALHEEHGLTCLEIAEKFETSKHTIKEICMYRTRNRQAVKWKPRPGK